ncbi:MAG TPA: hypothetical protein H9828_06590 [Candidatus Alistipes intestinigallinarum]|uniref:Uncharacterized protein n=1 Tax=Candidatus Alistipes intestinigallinarum TaxID=2838440 RepID=A0A9D1Z160_9BACT|nr:hypothetical protein [Candidatus Alistipes intestinigallinarum]
MQFTQIPQPYAPLGQAIRYAVEQETAGNLDVRIVDEASETLVGAKRFAETTSAAFDIAPMLRRTLQFTPTTGGTGFQPAGERSITVRVDALETGSEAVAATAPARTFLPGDEVPAAPCIRTTMPLERLIPEGAADELTLWSDEACAVTVSGQSADSVTAESYHSEGVGIQIFRLDTRDFPACETLTVDAGACGVVRYTVIPASQEAVRMAWRTHCGSIEHYSFPVVRSTTLRIAKQRAESADGILVTAAETDRETELVSAYETPEVLEALAEIIAAPQVWSIDGEACTPVDVVTQEAVVQQRGVLRALELVVRPKNSVSWN